MQQWRGLSEANNSICLRSTVSPKDTNFTKPLATYLNRKNKTYLDSQGYAKIMHQKCTTEENFELAAYTSQIFACSTHKTSFD